MLDYLYLLVIPAYMALDYFVFGASMLLSYLLFNALHLPALQVVALAAVSIARMGFYFGLGHLLLGLPLSHPIFLVLCAMDFRHGLHKAPSQINDVTPQERRATLIFCCGVFAGQVAMALLMLGVVAFSLMR